MSTFQPELHGKPETLTVEIWRGEGVRVTNNGTVTCQGRSVNDMVQAISDFLHIRLIVPEESP